MKGKYLIAGVVLVLTVALLLPAYGQPAPKPVGTLRIAVSTLGVDRFDPLTITIVNKPFLTLLYDSLVGHTTDGQLSTETGIAYKWEMTPDGKTWAFYLREGIKFHNGDKLTAEDVKFHLDRVFDKSSSSTGITGLRKLIGEAKVEGPYKVVVHCKEPAIFLAEMLSELSGAEGMICPKRYLEEKGINYFAVHPIGTGPYKLKEFVSGVHVLYEAAFDKHFSQGEPKYQYVKFLIIPEEAARIGLLQRGEVDIAEISREKRAEVEAAGIRTARDPGVGVIELDYHTAWDPRYPVHDKRVREAISLAIDKESLLKHVWGGMGKRTGHFIAVPMTLGYKPLDSTPYDPERAKKLLVEAGYPNGFDLKLHYYPSPGFPEGLPTMEAVVSYLAKVGIRAKIVMYPDYATFRVLRMSPQEKCEGGLSGPDVFGARFYPLSSTHFCFHSQGQVSGFKDPVLDDLIDRAMTSSDRKKAAELTYQVYVYTRDNYITLPLFELDGLFGVSKEVPSNWNGGIIGWDWNLEGAVMR